MSKRIREITFDTLKLGQAIRVARQQKQLTREQLSEILEITPRHLSDIENYGKHPSIEVLYRAVTLFDISVDQYIFTDKSPAKSSCHRRIEKMLAELSECDLIIVESTMKGIKQAKDTDE